MAAVKDLSNQLKKLEEQLVCCMKCGMCQSVCPLFEQTHKEADVARGKLVLLESLMNDIFDNPLGVQKRLNKCLLCGSCAANCPSGVNIIEIFIKARAIITNYLSMPLLKQLIFKKMLAHPKTFDRIVGLGSKLQKFILSHEQKATGTASIRLISPLLKERKIIPFADRFFQESSQALIKKSKNTGPRVVLFTGCLIDKIFPRIGIATIKVLHHHNVHVIIPKDQGCCGIPALAAGDTNTFSSLVDHHLALLKQHEFDYMVTACATCTSTIKKLWPSIDEHHNKKFKDHWIELSNKTMDISQFLSIIPGIKKQDKNLNFPSEQVTYHDPCHLAKSLGVRNEPRELIQACGGFELKEVEDPDRCCGMGGSFNLYHYDISSKIGNIKKENIEVTGCKTVATSCPACMMQISDMLSKGKGDIKVKHPIELYAKGLEQNVIT